jgi:hypothetical protein
VNAHVGVQRLNLSVLIVRKERAVGIVLEPHSSEVQAGAYGTLSAELQPQQAATCLMLIRRPSSYDI